MKYKVEMEFDDGSTELQDELFDTEQEADEFGRQWISDYHVGAEVLHMSNPGDYPLDEDEEVNFPLIEVED